MGEGGETVRQRVRDRDRTETRDKPERDENKDQEGEEKTKEEEKVAAQFSEKKKSNGTWRVGTRYVAMWGREEAE